MSDREGFFVCELDMAYLDSIRGNMLCLNQILEGKAIDDPYKVARFS